MSPRADRRARIATARLLRGNPDGGDNGGMPPDLDARVKALEARTSEIGVDVRAVIKDVAEIKGKISQMPTTTCVRSSTCCWVTEPLARSFPRESVEKRHDRAIDVDEVQPTTIDEEKPEM